MKKKCLFFVLALLFVTKTMCQISVPIFKKDSVSINNYLYSYIQANFKLENYDTMCLSSCTFVKFNVNEVGKVDDIHFTYLTPDIIKTIFKQALLSTNGFWKFKTKSSKAMTFLLPVVFIFEDKCEPKEGTSNSVLNLLMDDDNPRAVEPALPGTAKNAVLNCIILNPMFLKSGYE